MQVLGGKGDVRYGTKDGVWGDAPVIDAEREIFVERISLLRGTASRHLPCGRLGLSELGASDLGGGAVGAPLVLG
jgi:hypothetical protein